jgi:hypothetical protein
MFNDIGYELAEANNKLSQALEYAECAVRETEESLQKVKLAELKMEDLGEKQRKKQAAIHMYKLALAASSLLSSKTDAVDKISKE